MAITWTDGTLRFTAQGDGVDQRFRARAITIRASADTWVVVLKDLDGVATKFEMANDVANNRGGTFDVSNILFVGCVLSTATDITSVTLNDTQHLPA